MGHIPRTKNRLSSLLLLLPLLFCVNSGFSQTATLSKTTQLNVALNAPGKMCDVTFTATKEISNLLVLVTDSKGNTVFLENKYRFSGAYNRTIDLSQGAAGDFNLQIVNDDEKINKVISMK